VYIHKGGSIELESSAAGLGGGGADIIVLRPSKCRSHWVVVVVVEVAEVERGSDEERRGE
jgi:hypothetical protein